jgi:hypothetical protein
VYSSTLKRRARVVVTARIDASGAGKRTEASFHLDLRPEIRWPQAEVPRKEEDGRQRSVGTGRRENQILGGSDPALSGLAAAQRLPRRGSLPPNVSTRISRSVAGRVSAEAVRHFELHQQ